MSKSAEMWQDQKQDCSMQECIYAHEEQAFHNAVQEVKGFIESGAVTYEQVERILRGIDNDS